MRSRHIDDPDKILRESRQRKKKPAKEPENKEVSPSKHSPEAGFNECDENQTVSREESPPIAAPETPRSTANPACSPAHASLEEMSPGDTMCDQNQEHSCEDRPSGAALNTPESHIYSQISLDDALTAGMLPEELPPTKTPVVEASPDGCSIRTFLLTDYEAALVEDFLRRIRSEGPRTMESRATQADLSLEEVQSYIRTMEWDPLMSPVDKNRSPFISPTVRRLAQRALRSFPSSATGADGSSKSRPKKRLAPNEDKENTAAALYKRAKLHHNDYPSIDGARKVHSDADRMSEGITSLTPPSSGKAHTPPNEKQVNPQPERTSPRPHTPEWRFDNPVRDSEHFKCTC
jgi:hypothetical protein